MITDILTHFALDEAKASIDTLADDRLAIGSRLDLAGYLNGLTPDEAEEAINHVAAELRAIVPMKVGAIWGAKTGVAVEAHLNPVTCFTA